MIEKVRQTLRRHAMTRPGDRIGVAVSGGADSTALLLALDRLAPRFEIELGVVHLNHGLRGAESDADESFVRELADRLGLPVQVRRAALTHHAGNLEATGRRARYAFFQELIEQKTYDRIATGHTRSDQAETVLFRLLRGAGTAGLAGVRPTREPGVIRPLIDIERQEILVWLLEQGARWRDDSSNLDTCFARNRLRRELLPQLRREWNPQIDSALARHAAQSAADADYWRKAVADQLEMLIVRRSDGVVILDCERAALLHPALLGRVLRGVATELGAAADGLGADRTGELVELTTAAGGDGGLDLPGLRAQRSFRWLRLSASCATPPVRAEKILEPPTLAVTPDRLTRMDLRLAESRVYNEAVLCLIDRERVPKPLRLRSWRPGDSLKRAAGRPSRKLRDLFQGSEVASWDRAAWPVIAAGEEGRERVVWARGFGVDCDFAAADSTSTALEVREITAEGREIRRIEDWLSGVYKD